jgi:hypothetical protein
MRRDVVASGGVILTLSVIGSQRPLLVSPPPAITLQCQLADARWPWRSVTRRGVRE